MCPALKPISQICKSSHGLACACAHVSLKMKLDLVEPYLYFEIQPGLDFRGSEKTPNMP